MKISAHLLLWLGIAVVAFAGGCYWRDGQTARSDNRQLRDNLKQLTETADALRQSAVQSALNNDAAIRRLDEVARAREEDREEIQKWAAGQQDALQALARAQPELGNHAGAGVLQHWNRSNAGADAAGPAPADAAGQPGAAVPIPSGGAQRRMDRPDCQSRSGDRAVSRLSQSNGAVARCGTAVGGNRLGMVLRIRTRDRPDGGALPA